MRGGTRGGGFIGRGSSRVDADRGDNESFPGSQFEDVDSQTSPVKLGRPRVRRQDNPQYIGNDYDSQRMVFNGRSHTIFHLEIQM